jgi:hypothetical protein
MTQNATVFGPFNKLMLKIAIKIIQNQMTNKFQGVFLLYSFLKILPSRVGAGAGAA